MARRILVLNERDLRNPLAGGAEVHLFETFGRLALRGHEITLLCATFPGCARRETVDGIRVVRLTNRYLFYVLVPWVARRMAVREGYDVVVDVLCKLPFLSPWIVPRPCIALVHHLFGSTAFQQVSFPIALATYLSEKLIPYAYASSLAIAVSPSTRDDLIARGMVPARIVVVPNGVDHELYRPDASRRSRTPLIVWLGRAEPYKRVELLMESIALLRREIPGLRLAVVGDGNAIPALRQTAHRLGVSDIVDFLGFVSGSVKVEMLERAHVLANTSEKEGWGLTVLEGAACGTPTVASDVPGLRDSVRDGQTGVLVPHGDVAALTRALSAILTNDALRERLSRGALEWAARFTWDASADDVERMIEAVAVGQPAETVRAISSPFAT